MKVGIVCPYSWEIPGGVQAHVRDLAESLRGRGHVVSVLSPGDEDDLPEALTEALSDDHVAELVLAGNAFKVHYNGSVARLQFGPVSAARVRRWLREGGFDVVHVHEPATTSLPLLACMISDGPLVATFHMATERSRLLLIFDTVLQPFLEKLTGRIAVSPAARAVVVEHFGGDAVVVPNGVDVAAFASAVPPPGLPHPGGAIGFVGRYDEPRKGMDVLVAAMPRVIREFPDVRLVVAGHGDEDDFRRDLPADVAPHVDLLGRVDDAEKASMLAGVDVYCAPNTGQESFGVILLEAMAARTAIVASDLTAFRRVLTGPGTDEPAGEVVPVDDPHALAEALCRLLGDPARRQRLIDLGDRAVAPYDWEVVTSQIERVYDLAMSGAAPARPTRPPRTVRRRTPR